MSCITVLPLQFYDGHHSFPLHLPVLKDPNGLVLVDCGYAGFLPEIEKALAQAGLRMADVSKLIITHHDHDHMGAMKEILDKYPTIEVISSTEQKPYLTGEKPSLRLIQAERLQASLSAEEKADGERFIKLLGMLGTVKHITSVNDGDILPICGGLEVINTSGHMPGHISLYLIREKTLITGDALAMYKGRLSIANPGYALDLPQAVESVRKLLSFDIVKIICYHGGVYDGDIPAALMQIIAEYN